MWQKGWLHAWHLKMNDWIGFYGRISPSPEAHGRICPLTSNSAVELSMNLVSYIQDENLIRKNTGGALTMGRMFNVEYLSVSSGWKFRSDFIFFSALSYCWHKGDQDLEYWLLLWRKLLALLYYLLVLAWKG